MIYNTIVRRRNIQLTKSLGTQQRKDGNAQYSRSFWLFLFIVDRRGCCCSLQRKWSITTIQYAPQHHPSIHPSVNPATMKCRMHMKQKGKHILSTSPSYFTLFIWTLKKTTISEHNLKNNIQNRFLYQTTQKVLRLKQICSS